MWGTDDPLEDLSREAVSALVVAQIEGKTLGVRGDLPSLPKLRSAPRRVLKALPGEVPHNLRPNDTVTVSISLPAYLVIGCGELGGVEVVARRAIRDALKDAGIKWWYPRFLIRVDLPD